MLIIFTEKADQILSDIISKYGLQETTTEVFEKYKVGKTSKLVLLDHLARDFALQIISEKDLIDFLEKELNVSRELSEKISKDIINTLVPLLQKVSEEQLENHDNNNQPFSNSQQIKPTVSPIQEIKKPMPIIKESKPQIKKRDLDRYRESIE